jgi:Mrp family chromosome partitioning ATPase
MLVVAVFIKDNAYIFLKFKIGVLDIDICGPSLPQVFGVQDQKVPFNLS